MRASVSDVEIQGMLRLRKFEQEQTLREDLQRLRQIEARLQHNGRSRDALDVLIRSVPEHAFLSVRASIPSPSDILKLIRLMDHVVPARVGHDVLGPLVAVVYTEAFTLTDNDVAFGYVLKQPVAAPIALSDEYVLDTHELPAVATMATAVQVGGLDLVFGALERIGAWIEVNGYRIAGPYREVGIALPEMDTGAEIVVEVQMPIAPFDPTLDVRS